jgi:ferredoxin--NADP+ reductase
MPFKPGQFLHLAVEREEGKILNRPYSVASPHGAEIEFFIVEVSEGQLTPMFRPMKVGDPLLVSQRAAGSFTLDKTPELESIWLFATGTGLAPYIAMLRDDEIWNRYRRIVLVHGSRYERDLGYRDELVGLHKARPEQFYYVPTITRESANGVLTGRLTDLMESGRLEEFAETRIEPNTTAVMLCGNPAMLDDMEAMLIARKLSRHKHKAPGNIVVERYW